MRRFPKKRRFHWAKQSLCLFHLVFQFYMWNSIMNQLEAKIEPKAKFSLKMMTSFSNCCAFYVILWKCKFISITMHLKYFFAVCVVLVLFVRLIFIACFLSISLINIRHSTTHTDDKNSYIQFHIRDYLLSINVHFIQSIKSSM